VRFIQTLSISSTVYQDREKKADKIKDSGLSPEELMAKQEELFAASRAKFSQPQGQQQQPSA
jgi:hypothetical protein